MPSKHAKIEKSWLLYGPSGCGKSRLADRIARLLGLREILDDWKPGDKIPPLNTLVISDETFPEPHIMLPFANRTVSFAIALQAVKKREAYDKRRDPRDVRPGPTNSVRGAA